MMWPGLLELETSQVLLRYVSECDPRGQENGKGTTKGGYLKGRVNVPFQGGPLLMRLDLVPTEDVVQKIRKDHKNWTDEVVMAHPNIIHNIRFRNGKRNCHLEPVPYNHSTKLEYMIDQGTNIRICNGTSDLDFVRPEADVPSDPESNDAIVGKLEQDANGRFFFQLGKKEDEGTKGRATNKNTKKDLNEMNLIPLQPKQKSRAKSDEANITDVLLNRLGAEKQGFLDDLMSFYSNSKKGKNAINLKNFRLRVQFFDYDMISRSTGSLLWYDISKDIKDTGNKNNGAMDIFDVTNQKSCCKGGRKITITSEWNLAVKDVEPRLQVYDAEGNHIEHETMNLNQPSDEKAVKKLPIVKNLFVNFLSPEQDYKKVRSIQFEKGLTIKLLLYRKSDESESPKKFNFHYIEHKPNGCVYCDYKVDSDSAEDLAEGQPRAQPNRSKRSLPGSRDTNAKKSKQENPGYCHSPTYDSDDSGFISSPPRRLSDNWENPLEESVPIASTSRTLYTTMQSPVHISGGIQELSSDQTILQTWTLPLTITETDQSLEEADFPDTRSIIENDPLFKEPPVQRVSVIVNSEVDNMEELNTPLMELSQNPFMGFVPTGVFMEEQMSHDGTKKAVNEEPVVEDKDEEKEKMDEQLEEEEEEEDPELVKTGSRKEMMVHLQLLMIVVLILMMVSAILPEILSSSSTVLVGVLSLIYLGFYRYRASEIKC